jgi:VanZ family protein
MQFAELLESTALFERKRRYFSDAKLAFGLNWRKRGEKMHRQTLRKSSKAAFLFFVLLWMVLIFIFSSQPYESQDLKSWLKSVLSFQQIERYLSDVELKYGGHLISIKSLGLTGFVEFFIRKSANVTVYALLGVLIFQSLRMLLPRVWGVSLISISLSYLYAVADEYHQSLIFDRTSLFADVLLDTGGAIFGVILFILLSKLVSVLYQKFFEK